jgi:AmmeMemoRadiSam system protein A
MQNRACGLAALMILKDLARRRHWQPVLLHYSNSGDATGDHSRVVGYAAIAFFGGHPMDKKKQDDSNPHFTEPQGQALVTLARHTIMKKLGRKVPADEARSLEAALQDKAFNAHCGTFVTLKIDGQLRGCIGNLTSDASVANGIRENAINAAFRDPRFAPLSDRELDKVQIEVSILTEPRPLEFDDPRDLAAKLRVNVDGVILRKGYASATFLPQVWEQLPQPEDFLSQLCLKAGLPADAWQHPGLEVLTYQVQYFEKDR